MSKISKKTGVYLKKNYPGLYSFIIRIIAFFMSLTEDSTSFYIVDYLGGSYKDYFLENDMKQRIADLTKNLDPDSAHTVNVLMERFMNYPEHRFHVRMKVKDKDIAGGLLKEESPENRKLVSQSLDTLHKQYNIRRKLMEPSVFYYCHGLTCLPEKVIDYIKGTDFIDLGAYIGDSALSLHRYACKKMYSIEISVKSIEKYRQLMQKNHIDKSKYKLINVAIASRDNLPPLVLSDSGYSNLSANQTGAGDLIVDQKTLDSLVSEYKIVPKLIKADIEGHSLELVKGAVETLKKHRPVLCLSIYHNPYEFFEVKPFLESILNDYTYMIRKFTTSPYAGGCHGETTLLGYPNEALVKKELRNEVIK